MRPLIVKNTKKTKIIKEDGEEKEAWTGRYEVSGSFFSKRVFSSHISAFQEAESRKEFQEKYPFIPPKSKREKEAIKYYKIDPIDYTKVKIKDYTKD